MENNLEKRLKSIKAVFFDIDDTFSGGDANPQDHARITSQAYEMLWKLRQKKITLVPVTGRPAGWCDHIARMWPIDAIVGENGAFYLEMKNGKLVKNYLEPAKTRLANQKKLALLKTKIQKKFKEARFASDQAYREFDLAIDYCEDVKPWKDSRVQELLQFCHDQKAMAKLSSIHVNTWFGKYDKLSCVRKFCKERMSVTWNEIVYLGDSPNDEPFFKALPFTVGVANVKKFLPKMKSKPTLIMSKPSGMGFAEFGELLLKPKFYSSKS